jgi:DNA ligase-1
MPRKSNKREFLQLAKTFKLGKDNPAGMYISEKLDGARCFWDGGVSRGCPTVSVPWANVKHPQTGELKPNLKETSTGLWSRYGNPIAAPDWWLNKLPAMFLDGELFAGRGNFQTLRSIVAKKEAVDAEWHNVQFAVFGCPTADTIFQAGEIKNSNMVMTLDNELVMRFVRDRSQAGVLEQFTHIPGGLTFEQELSVLGSSLPNDDFCYLHRHVLLPNDQKSAETQMESFMDYVLDEGGEGVMLRQPNSIWTPKRTKTLLKLKPFTDDKGTIVGFVSGRQTDKGSKLRGLIGAVILDYKGKRLELSGFTDEERKFDNDELTAWAYQHPGEEMPEIAEGKYLKKGYELEFRYRELSDDGIPKEARYARAV